jgi:hypothetical protein
MKLVWKYWAMHGVWSINMRVEELFNRHVIQVVQPLSHFRPLPRLNNLYLTNVLVSTTSLFKSSPLDSVSNE